MGGHLEPLLRPLPLQGMQEHGEGKWCVCDHDGAPLFGSRLLRRGRCCVREGGRAGGRNAHEQLLLAQLGELLHALDVKLVLALFVTGRRQNG